MSPFFAELLGTALLVLFGNGVVANVVLARTKGNNAGWVVITAGWGVAVFVAAFCSAPFSGAHLNPAVTLAMAIAGKLPIAQVVPYVVAQMLGAIIGAVLVYLFYFGHFKVSEDADGKLACFCTAPALRHVPQAFFCEVVGTFCLILPIFLIRNVKISWPAGTAGTEQAHAAVGMGSLGLIPVGLLVFGIGLSLGGTTGYAINPARDLGPRIAHAFLPIAGKRDSDWGYAWVPVVGPLVGAALAAAVQTLFVV